MKEEKIYKKIKVFAICGKAGSGKDTIMKLLFNLYKDSNLHKITPCTTRPMREGESEGDPYYFITPEEYSKELLNGELVEATSFRNWFYGTPLKSFRLDKINVGVFNPEGINCLLDNPIFDVEIIYIDVSDRERLIRQLTREGTPDVKEIIRRYHADDEDFKHLGLDYGYITLDNNSSSKEDLYKVCEKLFELTQCQK